MLNRLIWTGGRITTGLVVDPAVNRFRRRHGLPPVRGAVFGRPSSRLDLQLYSEHFAPRPPDWDLDRRPAGFCFYDPADELPPELEEFLDAGEPPILFTLGSAAVRMPGDFYRHAAETLRALGQRGILLTGPEENRPERLDGTCWRSPMRPTGRLMPRVRAVVHQCGIGTLSHTLRAGVPFRRLSLRLRPAEQRLPLEALGVAELLPPRRRTARGMGEALRRLLAGPASERARGLGRLIRGEDGPAGPPRDWRSSSRPRFSSVPLPPFLEGRFPVYSPL